MSYFIEDDEPVIETIEGVHPAYMGGADVIDVIEPGYDVIETVSPSYGISFGMGMPATTVISPTVVMGGPQVVRAPYRQVVQQGNCPTAQCGHCVHQHQQPTCGHNSCPQCQQQRYQAPYQGGYGQYPPPQYYPPQQYPPAYRAPGMYPPAYNQPRPW